MFTTSDVRRMPERGSSGSWTTTVRRAPGAAARERPLSLQPTVFVPLRRGEDPLWQDVVARKV